MWIQIINQEVLKNKSWYNIENCHPNSIQLMLKAPISRIFKSKSRIFQIWICMSRFSKSGSVCPDFPNLSPYVRIFQIWVRMSGCSNLDPYVRMFESGSGFRLHWCLAVLDEVVTDMAVLDEVATDMAVLDEVASYGHVRDFWQQMAFTRCVS